MNLNIIYTEQAERDLRDIYDYIAFNLLRPEIVKEQAKHTIDAVESLNEMPLRHQLYEKKPWKSPCLRVLKVNN